MIDLGTDDLRYDIDGHVATITIDRPEAHNALTPEMMAGLPEAIFHADADDEVRSIVVTGGGEEAFCAGADLERTIPELASGARGEAGADAGFDEQFALRHDLVRTPVIAAINGLCVAGGFEFILATDICIAEEHARLGAQEPRWGIMPASPLVRLPRQIPYRKAMEYLLTGDLFPAEHALDAGILNEVVPRGESLARAEEVAESIGENSPFVVRKMKETVRRGLEKPPEDALRLEDDISEEVMAHPHASEGPRAFMNDEEPSWRS